MSKLLSFNFECNNTRIIEDGKLWFNANDFCRQLGYRNIPAAISAHCSEGGIAKYDTPTSSGMQSMLYIDEGNLYRLVRESKLPGAKKFESWVYDEVLPSIRKTGSYSVSQHDLPSYQIEDPIKRALKWVDEYKGYQKQIEVVKTELVNANDTIEIQQPLVELAQDLIINAGHYTMAKAGGMLGYGRNNLFDLLRRNHIIQPNSTMPYRRYLDAGYFVVKIRRINDIITDGTQTFVTAKGLTWLHKLINRHKEELESKINTHGTDAIDNHYHSVAHGGYTSSNHDIKNIDNETVDVQTFLNTILDE